MTRAAHWLIDFLTDWPGWARAIITISTAIVVTQWIGWWVIAYMVVWTLILGIGWSSRA